MESVAAVLAGGAMALVGKIVWDWLSKKNGNYKQPCEYLLKLLSDHHELQLKLATDITSLKDDIKYIKHHIMLDN